MMKTKKMKTAVFGACALAGTSALAGWNLSLSEGWRVTAGAEFGGPVNANVKTRSAGPHGVVPRTLPGVSRAQAQSAVSYSGERLAFADGAFIDPDSSLRDSELSWNWHLPLSAASGVAGRAAYREVSASEGIGTIATGDDGSSAGVSLEFSRTLWTDDRRPIGVDFAFGLAWMRKNNLVRSEGVGFRRDETVREGTVSATLGDQLWMRESGEVTRYGDGYGVGTFDGPGPVMDLTLLGTEETSYSRTTHYAERVATRGDWEEWDFRFTLKPWWDVTDWLRLYGTFGLELARTHFDMNLAWSDGVRSGGRGRSFDSWQVNGLVGLGGALRWKCLELGADVLARFLQHDVTIDDREVRGTIDRQTWFARVYLGLEF